MKFLSTPPSPLYTLPRLNEVAMGLSRTNRLFHLSAVSREDGSPLTDAHGFPPLKMRGMSDRANVGELSVPPLPTPSVPDGPSSKSSNVSAKLSVYSHCS